MKLKQAILQVLDRDGLKVVVDGLEIEVADRRSASELATAMSRSHRATPEAMLEYLSESAVKAVCEVHGIPSTGRRGKLIRSLLTAARASNDGQAAKSSGPRRMKATNGRGSPAKEKKSMSADETTRDSQEQVTRLPEPPPGMHRVTKTELVWPGKYNEDGTLKEVPRVSLPFQVIERVNESRATRVGKKEKGPTLFDIWEHKEGDTFESGWRNKLVWGDNLLVMGSLLEQFAGKIKLIYIDPPFATGADFSFVTRIGEDEMEVTKEQSVIEEKAYRDTWGRGLQSYLGMLSDRLVLLRELLSEDGSIYLHLDETVAHFVKVIMDEVFSASGFRNDIVVRSTFSHADANQFGSVHQNLLFYTKGSNYTYSPVYVPYEEDYIEKYYRYRDEDGRKWLSCSLTGAGASGGQFKWKDVSPPPGRHWAYTADKLDEFERQGRIYWTRNGIPRMKQYLDEMSGMPASDVWWDKNCQPLLTWTSESIGYATQKPESLLERVIAASSVEGDLVADFFCGSGTTRAVAEKRGRRWIGCDLGRWAVHLSRKRLLEIEGCRPFEVLNLGKYERQYWQSVAFGQGKEKAITEKALYEYLAFVLRLYGAQPVAGLAHLHGKKGRAMVHIGAVDAPVTIDEISAAIDECVRLKQPELHVLGWEWEMGLAGPNNEYRKGGLMQDEARKKGVKLILRQIPREMMEEQAADKGDIEFFELAYLEVEIKHPKKLTAQVQLKDFVIPNTDLIPEDVRGKVKKWSDYIDYWSVDWDFQEDTFMQGWVAYRTREDRSLPLTSDSHVYAKPGRYRILIKVIDIFGNDTSQAHTVEVK